MCLRGGCSTRRFGNAQGVNVVSREPPLILRPGFNCGERLFCESAALRGRALGNGRLSSLSEAEPGLRDVDSHIIIACQAARGPQVDITEFQPLVTEALTRVRWSQLAADAGYDSEANHRFALQDCRIRSIIPPTRGRLTDMPASGHYRRLMQLASICQPAAAVFKSKPSCP